MMNMSIECDVTSCRYHHEAEAYCTLNCIKVTHEGEKGHEEADCASFCSKENTMK